MTQQDMFAQPQPGNVHQHPAAPPIRPSFRIEPETGVAREEDVNPALLKMAQAMGRILATRLLLLLAVVTASAVWGYCVWEPTTLRIGAAGAFSFLTVWPLTWLYFKKG